MDMRIPPLRVKILPESNPPKSIILARRLVAVCGFAAPVRGGPGVASDPPDAGPTTTTTTTTSNIMIIQIIIITTTTMKQSQSQ